jgi:hypothetical protein
VNVLARQPDRPTAAVLGARLPVPRLLREPLVIAVALLLYLAVRIVTEGSRAAAFRNARRIIDLEAVLGLRWEHGLQHVVLAHEWLLDVANWIYVWGHWPVLAASVLWLNRRRPAAYRVVRNALFVSGAIGLLVFAFFPVAPPRFVDAGLLDTVVRYSEGYKALQPPSLVNQFAAVPSFHFGWSLLVCGTLAANVRPLRARVLIAAMPVAMAFAVVATANHFVLDVAAGGLVSLTGLLVAARLPGLRPRPAPAHG